MTTSRNLPSADGVDRRTLFGVVGAGSLTVAGLAGCSRDGAAKAVEVDPKDPRKRSWSPHEEHQAGISSPTPAVTTLIALDLKPSTDKDALRRWFRIWTADIEALMEGRRAPGDPLQDMAQPNVSLSVTVGLGPRVFTLKGLEELRPDGLAEIPPMKHDKLVEAWSGGDVVVQVCADDPTSAAYAERILVRDAASFATQRWVQRGSWRGVDAEGKPITGRNLFGQVDGTGNVVEKAAEKIWTDGGQPWFAGGTMMVVRRIEMNLTTWDEVTRERQEKSMGRTLDTGAPLGSAQEMDPLNLGARGKDGQLVIPIDSHARLSNPGSNGGRTMLRRSTNYTHDEGGRTSHGLVFVSFQTSIPGVFTPVQKRLDASDALNEWTVAIGSAVFAVPGGWPKGKFLAHGLFA